MPCIDGTGGTDTLGGMGSAAPLRAWVHGEFGEHSSGQEKL